MAKLSLKVSTYLEQKSCLRLIVSKYFGLIFGTELLHGIYRSRQDLFMLSQSKHELLPILGVPVLPLFVRCRFFPRGQSSCSLGIIFIFKYCCNMTQLRFYPYLLFSDKIIMISRMQHSSNGHPQIQFPMTFKTNTPWLRTLW